MRGIAASKRYHGCMGGLGMRTKSWASGSIVAVLLAIALPAFAHHAWQGYDMKNLTTVQGTVTEFDWENPHVWMRFEATNSKGNTEKWWAGAPSPSRMAGTGW